MSVNEFQNKEGEKCNSSRLEHALLESLFYNEMITMDDPSSLSSDFMAYLSSNEVNNHGTPDAGAIAEKAMLRDFGVSSSSVPNRVDHINQSSQNRPPQSMNANAWTERPEIPERPVVRGQSESSAHVAAGQITGAERSIASKSNEKPVLQTKPEEQTHHMISQFAVLARRLGISLPSGVLSTLSNKTKGLGDTVNTPSLNQNHPEALSGIIQSEVQKSIDPGQNESGDNDTDESVSGSATDSRKRSRAEDSTVAKAPPHSKRRKKPNLSDCESKLSALKAENEMLKRHLDTVTNKSQRFEEERKKQEKEMKRLMQEGAGAENLNPLLKKFSEMYSDYGHHRHQELTFHLDQLQRLIAPTDFTKMGLFTMGQNEQNKGNPIAGILRKELHITTQQGRKIVEQSQKIRDLTDNLKECVDLLGKLKSICKHKQEVFSNRMSKCQEILNPLQVVKLLLWVDEHSNILESRCPGWRSERIHSKQKATR